LKAAQEKQLTKANTAELPAVTPSKEGMEWYTESTRENNYQPRLLNLWGNEGLPRRTQTFWIELHWLRKYKLELEQGIALNQKAPAQQRKQLPEWRDKYRRGESLCQLFLKRANNMQNI
jgi:hypothetical protein